MENKKTKKLNVLHLEASPGWGGQEMRILKESQALRNLGHSVIIAVEKNGGLVRQAKEKEFTTYEIRFRKIFWPVSFFRLISIIKRHDIDIINTHSSEDAWLGGLVGKLLKIVVIRTRHLSTGIKKGLNSRLLYGYLADFVITTCKEIVDVIVSQAKKDPKKCISIPTGVDFSKFKTDLKQTLEFKEKFNIKKDDFLVGTVCFMRSWKGIDDLLKTAKILENENDIKFLIIGGGHIETYIKLAKVMKLKNVIFTNHLENPKSAISALDVFVLLSTAHEGVSQASLQAAFLEKPLITTSIGGLKEVCIDDVTGIEVPVFSPDKVANAILKLKKDFRLKEKLAKNAKKLAKNFSLNNMIKQIHAIYEEIVD